MDEAQAAARVRENRKGIALQVRLTNIEPRCTVKYLGVTFDTRRFFGAHEKHAAERAEEKTGKHRRLVQGEDGEGAVKSSTGSHVNV